MNILWLSHLVPYPPTGIGALQRSHNLLKQLAKCHDVYLIAFIQTSLLENAFTTLSEGLRAANDALMQFCKKVEFVEIPCETRHYGKHRLAFKAVFGRKPYSIIWLESEKYAEIIKNWSINISFDIAHYDTISLAGYRLLAKARKHVLNHHNIESHMMSRRAEQEGNFLRKGYFHLEGRKLARYEINHCKLFDHHLTCSELDGMRLKELTSLSSVTEIPNGVDIDYFIPGTKVGDELQLVFAGSLDWYPNTDAMLFFADKVWPILKAQRPDLIMNLIGRKPPKQLLELADSDKNFRVHGFVDDVRPYINNSDVYVCPIRDGGGTKLKILDAFAMGKAVVAHPVACEGIDAKDGHNVLFAESPNEFSEKINLLLDNPEMRATMGRNARILIENNYSFQQIGSRLVKLYENLATGPL